MSQKINTCRVSLKRCMSCISIGGLSKYNKTVSSYRSAFWFNWFFFLQYYPPVILYIILKAYVMDWPAYSSVPHAWYSCQINNEVGGIRNKLELLWHQFSYHFNLKKDIQQATKLRLLVWLPVTRVFFFLPPPRPIKFKVSVSSTWAPTVQSTYRGWIQTEGTSVKITTSLFHPQWCITAGNIDVMRSALDISFCTQKKWWISAAQEVQFIYLSARKLILQSFYFY